MKSQTGPLPLSQHPPSCEIMPAMLLSSVTAVGGQSPVFLACSIPEHSTSALIWGFLGHRSLSLLQAGLCCSARAGQPTAMRSFFPCPRRTVPQRDPFSVFSSPPPLLPTPGGEGEHTAVMLQLPLFFFFKSSR